MNNCAARIAGLDCIRVVAALMVISIHVSANVFYPFKEGWLFSVIVDSFSRCAVPLFFMLSGYFLLNRKDYSIKDFIFKRFSRILIPFFMLCIIYKIVKGWSLSEFVLNVFVNSPFEYHLWYVYAIIGIYAFIPLINKVFLSPCGGVTVIIYYLLIWFLSFIVYKTFMKVFSITINPFSTFNFYYFQGFLGYVILGGFFRSFLLNFERKTSTEYTMVDRMAFWLFNRNKFGLNITSFVLYIFFSSFIVLGTYVYSHKAEKPIEIFFDYSNLFVFFQTIFLFFSLLKFKYFGSLLSFIAKFSYWIYLIHVLCMSIVLKYININENCILNIPLVILFTFLLSLIFSIPLFYIERFFLSFKRFK
jgi:surface polysaccharide O-acyltransferase-like enzyme